MGIIMKRFLLLTFLIYITYGCSEGEIYGFDNYLLYDNYSFTELMNMYNSKHVDHSITVHRNGGTGSIKLCNNSSEMKFLISPFIITQNPTSASDIFTTSEITIRTSTTYNQLPVLLSNSCEYVKYTYNPIFTPYTNEANVYVPIITENQIQEAYYIIHGTVMNNNNLYAYKLTEEDLRKLLAYLLQYTYKIHYTITY